MIALLAGWLVLSAVGTWLVMRQFRREEEARRRRRSFAGRMARLSPAFLAAGAAFMPFAQAAVRAAASFERAGAAMRAALVAPALAGQVVSTATAAPGSGNRKVATMSNTCNSCAMHPQGKFCLSHTCPDCGGYSADVAAHQCPALVHRTATSVYRLRVPQAEQGLLDLLVASSAERGVLVTGSYRDGPAAVLCFRIGGGDTAAIDHASSLIGTRTGASLHTGLGVHSRLVAES